MKTLFTFFILTASTAFSAPHPLTGSSVINRPQNSIALSQMGFRVSQVPDHWVFHNKIENESPTIEMGPEQKSLLTFRLEKVSSQISLENYVRKYLRDYNQYGFEILQMDSKSNGHLVVVDLKQKNKQTQSRQVFYHQKNKIVVATCADQLKEFSSTLKICNQILNEFRWN